RGAERAAAKALEEARSEQGEQKRLLRRRELEKEQAESERQRDRARREIEACVAVRNLEERVQRARVKAADHRNALAVASARLPEHHDASRAADDNVKLLKAIRHWLDLRGIRVRLDRQQ